MKPTILLPFILLTAGAHAAVHEVHVVETGDGNVWAFEPANLDVKAGDTLRFIDDHPRGHTVTSDDAGFHQAFSGEQADTIDVKLEDAGGYRFYCQPHPWMQTTITVAAASHTPAPDPQPDTQPDAAETAPAPLVMPLLALAFIARHRQNVGSP